MRIPNEVIKAAEAACSDSRARSQAGDSSVTPEEGAAYIAVVAALKDAGYIDPAAELVLTASNFTRRTHSPLAGRGLTP